MAGGKASDKQPQRDTHDDAPAAAAPRLTRSMAKAAVPLKFMSPGQTDHSGKSKPEKGKTVAEQSKKARTTTIQTTPTEQASEPPSDAFTAALVAIPAGDWCRTWAENRTMLLRVTSRRVKEVVHRLRTPHHETRSLQLQHQWPRCRDACRVAGTVPWSF